MTMVYGNGSNSSVGSQINTHYYQKKALIEAAKEMYFGQMADITNMPKNMGKTIKAYRYLPILHDANVNSEGIDAAGLIGNGVNVGTVVATIEIRTPGGIDGAGDPIPTEEGVFNTYYFTGENVDAAAAMTAAKDKVVAWIQTYYPTKFDTNYATTKTNLNGTGGEGWSFNEIAGVPAGGNLYGSSKDIGVITAKLPTLGETGGRYNRVGVTRLEIEGTLEKYGFFDEYSQESLDFDTDAELDMHIHREMITAANQINEDLIQMDILASAGIVRFPADASNVGELSGETGGMTVVTYDDLVRLATDLDNNLCPKSTKLISGSRMVDTKTIAGCRYMYHGSEVTPILKNMQDNFSERAFIPVHQYADAGNVARGEIGAIDQFRFIQVPNMLKWAGVGATETTNDGYQATDGKYDVFPLLAVGSGSFTTVGFQTDGKSVKFVINTQKPGKDSVTKDDPFGETGLMSIKWYYGFMPLRPEWIGVIKTVAPW